MRPYHLEASLIACRDAVMLTQEVSPTRPFPFVQDDSQIKKFYLNPKSTS